MLLQDQFKPPGEGAGGHGQVSSVTAENIILWGEGAPLIELQLPLAERTVLFQEASHFQREVHIPVPGGGFGFFHKDVLPRDLHRVAAEYGGVVAKPQQLPEFGLEV